MNSHIEERHLNGIAYALCGKDPGFFPSICRSGWVRLLSKSGVCRPGVSDLWHSSCCWTTVPIMFDHWLCWQELWRAGVQKHLVSWTGWIQRHGGRHQLGNPQEKKAQRRGLGGATTLGGQRKKREKIGKKR